MNLTAQEQRLYLGYECSDNPSIDEHFRRRDAIETKIRRAGSVLPMLGKLALLAYAGAIALYLFAEMTS